MGGPGAAVGGAAPEGGRSLNVQIVCTAEKIFNRLQAFETRTNYGAMAFQYTADANGVANVMCKLGA